MGKFVDSSHRLTAFFPFYRSAYQPIPRKRFRGTSVTDQNSNSMSAGPVACPIQRLNFDILWHIFDLNADIFNDYRALETTLAASYVCHDWRSLLLNSTSIWAHVMDLSHWKCFTAKGSRELIRRSGTALLWIQTDTTINGYFCERNQVLNILDTCWDRIQKLAVTIYNDLPNQWALSRPALHLESLRIFSNHEYSGLNNLWASLFSGDAPMLRDVLWRGYGLNITATSWLHQVGRMELSPPLTVSAILQVLESTINLTNLQLGHVLADNRTLTLPFVSLPKLAHLDLNLADKLTPGAVLLEHMYIPPSCTVRFSAKEIQQEEINKESTVGPIITVISACAQRCLAHHLPQQLKVVLTRDSFLFEATDGSRKPYFQLHINTVSRRFTLSPGKIHTTLLHELSKSGLSKVTLFDVRISRDVRDVSTLAAFTANLPSVETLVTEKRLLLYLGAYKLSKDGIPPPRAVFPVLKTIRLRSFKPSLKPDCKSDKPRDPVSKYVMGRAAWGLAISVIDFTDVSFDVLPNITFLRKANGLKVLWRRRNVSGIQEYICGTTAPPKLEDD